MRDKNLKPKWPAIVRVVAEVLGWLAVSIFMVWALVALCFDVRHVWLRIPAAVLFTVAVLGALFAVKGVWLRMAACVALLRGGAGVVVVAETNQRSSVGSGSFAKCVGGDLWGPDDGA